MAKKDRSPEFPTDWHQEAYLEGLEREVLGYQRRIAELPEDALGARADAESGLEAARAELRRLGKGQKTAAKRPRQAREKRSAKSK